MGIHVDQPTRDGADRRRPLGTWFLSVALVLLGGTATLSNGAALFLSLDRVPAYVEVNGLLNGLAAASAGILLYQRRRVARWAFALWVSTIMAFFVLALPEVFTTIYSAPGLILTVLLGYAGWRYIDRQTDS